MVFTRQSAPKYAHARPSNDHDFDHDSRLLHVSDALPAKQRLETGFPSERSKDSTRQRNHTDAAGPTAAQQLSFIEETHGHGEI